MAKKKAKSSADLKAKIKEMESKKREDVVVVQVEQKVSFDTWYHMRKKSIQAIHTKEVIWADFKSRKISRLESIKDYDKALELYGIKL